MNPASIAARKYLERKVSGRKTRVAVDRSAEATSSEWWTSLSSEERATECRIRGNWLHRGIIASEEQIRIYRDIVALCHERGVRVFGIRTPVNRPVAETVDPEANREAWRVVSEAGLDGLYDYTFLFDGRDLFLDPDHISDEGARLLLETTDRDTGLRLAK